jgi:cytochrome c oxidase subunit 2
VKIIKILLISLPGALLAAGCSGSPSVLQPGSNVTAQEAALYRIILIMAAVVFVVVEALLVYNLIVFRQRSDKDRAEPRQKYGNIRLEITWTVIPLLLVLTLFILTVRTMTAVAAPPPSGADVRINVIGHRWWWEFDYPDLGIKTANEFYVPVGKNIRLSLTSVDVIHSFWVPELSHKVDTIPGQQTELWFRTDQSGVYTGQCAEFCGENHANMRIKVLAVSDADFQSWVADQQKPLVQPTTDAQKKAYQLITKGICSSCHALGDNKPVQNIGPDLTHLMSRSVFAGATYPLNQATLREWLTDNQTMKPKNDMAIKLSQAQIDELMAYLTTLK